MARLNFKYPKLRFFLIIPLTLHFIWNKIFIIPSLLFLGAGFTQYIKFNKASSVKIGSSTIDVAIRTIFHKKLMPPCKALSTTFFILASCSSTRGVITISVCFFPKPTL